MPSYIDTKYVNLLSSRLPLFKRKNEGLFNFRCPLCGDSQKSKTKARGYLYQKERIFSIVAITVGKVQPFPISSKNWMVSCTKIMH